MLVLTAPLVGAQLSWLLFVDWFLAHVQIREPPQELVWEPIRELVLELVLELGPELISELVEEPVREAVERLVRELDQELAQELAQCHFEQLAGPSYPLLRTFWERLSLRAVSL